MGIQRFHQYHLIFFISVGVIFSYQNNTIAGIALSLSFSVIAVIITTFQLKKEMVLILSFKLMGFYFAIQWLFLLLIFLFISSLGVYTIIMINLLLIYLFFIQNALTIHRDQAAFQSVYKVVEQFDNTFLAVRAQRHDFLKHVNTIHYLLDEENNERAARYLGDLLTDYDIVNEAFNGEESHIASVLFQHAKLAENKGFTINYRLNVPASELPLQPIDQVNLLANLLENAVDAVNEAPREIKEIIVSTSIYGGIYRLEVVNSTIQIPDHILDHLFEKFNLTTKNGEHEGLGTYIINDIVTRYHGQIDYKYEVNKMTITVTLPKVTRE